MTCDTVRYGCVREFLLAAALGLGVLSTFAHPGRAFAALSTTEQGVPAVAAPAAPVALAPPPAPVAPVVQPPPAAQQQQRKAAVQHQQMPHRPMAGQGFNDPERIARRRAFVGGVIVGIVAARMRR